MTAEAGSPPPDSSGHEQETINKIVVNLTNLNRALRRNQRRVSRVAVPSFKQVGSTAIISFSVKRRILPGGSGSKAKKSGTSQPLEPGMPLIPS